jgi:hypothetical protein
LCSNDRELLESHFVPKALYRLVRAGTKGAHPVLVSAEERRQTSRQAVQTLLCADCEKRFDRNGENWVLRHCYRGRGIFRLRELLSQALAVHTSEEETIYSAHAVQGLEVDSLVYFCASVVWRASVTDWWLRIESTNALNWDIDIRTRSADTYLAKSPSQKRLRWL